MHHHSHLGIEIAHIGMTPGFAAAFLCLPAYYCEVAIDSDISFFVTPTACTMVFLKFQLSCEILQSFSLKSSVSLFLRNKPELRDGVDLYVHEARSSQVRPASKNSGTRLSSVVVIGRSS